MKKLPYYCCGATVYATPHIGNYKSIIAALDQAENQRILLNITDIDDKILALKKGTNHLSLYTYTNPIIREHIAQLKELGYDQSNIVIKRWSLQTKKTLSLLRSLNQKGHVRQVQDGFVYGKEDPNAEFYLWKKKDTPYSVDLEQFGKGVAGWHTECATLISRYCTKNLIHGGGADLKLHHENEQLQLKPLGYNISWIRTPLLLSEVKGKEQKMSKSVGNILRFTDNCYFNRFLLKHVMAHKKMTFRTIQCIHQEWKDYVHHKSMQLYACKNKKLKKALRRTLKKQKVVPLAHLNTKKKISYLVRQLDLARLKKNFTLSDRIRKLLSMRGFAIINSSDGSLVYRRCQHRMHQEKEA